MSFFSIQRCIAPGGRCITSVADHVEAYVLTCSRTGAAKETQVLGAVYQAASVLQVWHRMIRASVCQSVCAHVFMPELYIRQEVLY